MVPASQRRAPAAATGGAAAPPDGSARTVGGVVLMVTAWTAASLGLQLSMAHHQLLLVDALRVLLAGFAVIGVARPALAAAAVTHLEAWCDRPWVPVTVAVTGGGILLAVILCRHWAFETPAFDLRLHEELVRSTWHRPFMYSALLGYSFFAHHVVLLFPLVGLVYPLWPCAAWLLTIQSLLLAVAGWLVWSLARAHGVRPVITLALTVAFFGYRAVATGQLRGFHQEVVAIPFLLAFLWGERTGRTVVAAVASLLALACREDVAVPLLVYGALLCLEQRRRAAGAALMVVSAAWMLATYGCLLPAYAPTGGPVEIARWAAYGDTPAGIARGLLTHPGAVAAALTNPSVIGLFAALLFLPLASVRTMLPPLVPLIVCATSAHEPQATLTGAHGALFVPWLFAGAARVLGGSTLRPWLAIDRVALAVACALVLTNLTAFPLPAQMARWSAAHGSLAALERTPGVRRVLAQGPILPHLGWTADADLLGSPRASAIDAYDVVLVAVDRDPWPLARRDVAALAATLAHDPRWRRRTYGPLVVFERVGGVSAAGPDIHSAVSAGDDGSNGCRAFMWTPTGAAEYTLPRCRPARRSSTISGRRSRSIARSAGIPSGSASPKAGCRAIGCARSSCSAFFRCASSLVP